MINQLLGWLGYHKIEDLNTGGWCGVCGKWMPKEIFHKNDDWRISICSSHCEEQEKKYERLKEKVEDDLEESRKRHKKLWNY